MNSMLDLHEGNKHVLSFSSDSTLKQIRNLVTSSLNYKDNEYYLLCNGKILKEDGEFPSNAIHVVPKLCGGKGGFGSMLRAIGAQIEKTTNREACRDLSGRRLRDINEEKRLKNWIDQQSTRETEEADRKQKKLERLCVMPKHEFKDEQYDKERSELPERLEDAINQGLEASASSTATSGKRKTDEKSTATIKKKKRGLWLDDELDGLSSSDGGSSSEDEDGNKQSGNSSEEKDTKEIEETEDTVVNKEYEKNGDNGNEHDSKISIAQ